MLRHPVLRLPVLGLPVLGLPVLGLPVLELPVLGPSVFGPPVIGGCGLCGCSQGTTTSCFLSKNSCASFKLGITTKKVIFFLGRASKLMFIGAFEGEKRAGLRLSSLPISSSSLLHYLIANFQATASSFSYLLKKPLRVTILVELF